jgi:glycerol-3-phosphate dehydrogenase
VVNAAGPWVDAVRALEDPTATPRLHLSKGVHVVLPAARLPVRHMVVLSTPDRRSIFVIRRGGGVYVGTTDTSHSGGWDEWPPVTRADVDYLLAPLAASFRGEPPSAADVVASWSGLRPLIGEAGVAPTEISRKDELWVGARGVVTIAGGKLTGYRPMARRAVELAADEGGLRLREADEDGGPPLVGGDFAGGLGELASSLASSQAGVVVDEPTRLRLAALYGAESGDVLALGAEPLAPGTPTVRGEVDWAVCHEGAVHLEDVLYRRMRTALYEPGARESLVAPLAARMQGLLGWSDARSSEEQRATRARLEADLHFSREESS